LIPFKPADDLLTLLIPVAVALVVLLAVAAAVLAVYRRGGIQLGGARAPRRLKVLERLAVSRRSALLLVEYDGRTLLVGQSGEQLSLLESDKRAP
jgi:flagellar biogenesis protein FliO